MNIAMAKLVALLHSMIETATELQQQIERVGSDAFGGDIDSFETVLGYITTLRSQLDSILRLVHD